MSSKQCAAGAGMRLGDRHEEALDDAWLRDRRRTQHQLSTACAAEYQTTQARREAQDNVDAALEAEHYQAR